MKARQALNLTPANSHQGSAFLAVMPRLFAGFLSMKGFQMLVLRRAVSEEIIITVGKETIVVKLVDTIGTNHARLGFTASKNVRIDRKEIHDAIQETGFNPEAFPVAPLVPLIRMGERLPGELMRRKV